LRIEAPSSTPQGIFDPQGTIYSNRSLTPLQVAVSFNNRPDFYEPVTVFVKDG
jgi:hypothetical protein